MRGLVQLGIVVFAVALGIGVGHRLSPEAMAVVVGVVCGVLASIPTSVMLFVVSRRFSKPAQVSGAGVPAPYAPAYPPVVVIQADGAAQRNQLAPAWDPPAAAVENQPWRRSFTVVGEEDGW